MSSKILNVPYKSQLDPADANLAYADCGPCCLAMILAGIGKSITTNDVARAAGMVQGDKTGRLLSQLVSAAQKYGLVMAAGQSNLDDLKRLIDNGQPPVALVRYQNLPQRYDPRYTGGHYVLVVGYDDQNIFINDPYYPAGSTTGYQKAYSYQGWLAAWKADGATDQTYQCKLVYPTQQGLIGGTGGTPPSNEPTRDVYVIAPAGLQLRIQPNTSVGAPIAAIFGQHLTALGAESSADANGYTWQKVRTEAGVVAYVVASIGGERYLDATKPDEPFVVTVLDNPIVRGSQGLAVRVQPNLALNAQLRVQPGEHLTVYRGFDSGGVSWLWVKAPNGSYGYARAVEQDQPLVGTATIPPLDPAHGGATSSDRWISTPTGLNFRQDHTLSAPFVDNQYRALRKGVHLTVIGPTVGPDANNNTWQQVKVDDGRTGWVAVKVGSEVTVSMVPVG
jgi:uncharacterized protein YvpB